MSNVKKTSYVGYRIRNKNLNQFLEDLNNNKEHAVNVAKKSLAKNAAEEYKVLERTTSLAKSEIKSRIIDKIFQSQDRIKKGMEMNFKWSFHLKFNVFALENDVLVMVESDNYKAYEEFFKELGYEDYSYNTCFNKPLTICKFDWDEREKDWRKVGLISENNKAPNCFVYQVVQWGDYEKDMLNNDLFENLISTEKSF